MWDLNTLARINQEAARRKLAGQPERDAVFTATGVRDQSNPHIEATRDDCDVMSIWRSRRSA